MPCIVYSNEETLQLKSEAAKQEVTRLAAEVNEVSDFLCQVMGYLEKNKIVLPQEMFKIKDWWKTHKKMDSLRLAEGKREKINKEYNILKTIARSLDDQIDRIEKLGGMPGAKLAKDYDKALLDLASFEKLHNFPLTYGINAPQQRKKNK